MHYAHASAPHSSSRGCCRILRHTRQVSCSGWRDCSGLNWWMMLKNRSGSNLLKVFNKHVGCCTWEAASSSSVPSECSPSTYFKVLAYLCIISPMMHLLVLTYLPCIPDHCASSNETASQNTYDGPPLSLQ